MKHLTARYFIIESPYYWKFIPVGKIYISKFDIFLNSTVGGSTILVQFWMKNSNSFHVHFAVTVHEKLKKRRCESKWMQVEGRWLRAPLLRGLWSRLLRLKMHFRVRENAELRWPLNVAVINTMLPSMLIDSLLEAIICGGR